MRMHVNNSLFTMHEAAFVAEPYFRKVQKTFSNWQSQRSQLLQQSDFFLGSVLPV